MSGETFLDGRVTMLLGDVRAMLKTLPDDHFDCVVTSPPYWGLRDYGVAGQIGMERTLSEHIAVMVDVFREVRRSLKPTGVCWINYGDCYATAPNGRSAVDTKAKGNDDRTFRDKPFSTVGAIYQPDHEAGDRRGTGGNKGSGGQASHSGRIVAAGGKRLSAGEDRTDVDVGGWGSRDDGLRWRGGGYLKAKDLCMVPERLFIALQDDGWWVRSKLPWIKRNGMPESINDRPANSLEQVALLTKSERYWYDADAVRKPASPSTNSTRVAQNVEAQAGSARANGGAKTNGTMKAVVRKPGVTPKSAGEETNIRAKASWHESVAGPPLNDRNFRNTDLFFSSIEIPFGLISDADGTPLAIDANPQGFSEAHFATFPQALIEPLIRAGSSEAGICPHCALPWSRETEKTAMVIKKTARNDERGTRTGTSGTMVSPARSVTVGWAPSCDCPEHDPIPARVLDPFGGSGTTSLVSARLGRHSTFIELNPEYATLARARIEAAFMGKHEGQRHMAKQLGKDKMPFEAGSLFAAIDEIPEVAE
jgi:DNA modification methylase